MALLSVQGIRHKVVLLRTELPKSAFTVNKIRINAFSKTCVATQWTARYKQHITMCSMQHRMFSLIRVFALCTQKS